MRVPDHDEPVEAVGQLAELRAEVERLRAALQAEQHDQLTTRDHVIGLEARAEELRRKLKVHQIKLNKRIEQAEVMRTKIAAERRRAEAARRELGELKRSRSWRVGRALTRPFAVFRR